MTERAACHNRMAALGPHAHFFTLYPMQDFPAPRGALSFVPEYRFCPQGKVEAKIRMGHSRRKLDLTGQRYGKQMVLGPAPNIGSRTAWRCRCDCGRETVVQSGRLRSGHTSSCGCLGTGAVPGVGLPGLTYVDGTCVEMLKAKTVRKNNTSGVPGVDWLPSKQRWRATICFKGKRYYLGSYDLFEDAVKARKYAEENLHDKFLREFAQGPAAGNTAAQG